jgi:hypothetical protein
MKKFFLYTKNLLRHKYFVFLEACKLGIPLIGLFHDSSKFLPDEFLPYARYDFTKFGKNPPEIQSAFNLAWLKHQKRNKHHWQHWLLINDSGRALFLSGGWLKQVEAQAMPRKRILEMVADWRGAGRAYGNSDAVAWYMNNEEKMILHPATKAFVEYLLGV